jgi:predicted anti-sigma-YlaC factor YlaD
MSARLDGEALGVSERLVDGHLNSCSACREWQRRAEVLHRATRVAAAADVPDLSAAILAAAGEKQALPPVSHRIARLGLALVATLQLSIALPGMLFGSDFAVSLHLAHELASWELALAIGFLFAAIRPARAWGMLPLVAALVGCLIATSVVDVTSRHAGFGETTHGLELVGLACLWALARPMHSHSHSHSHARRREAVRPA